MQICFNLYGSHCTTPITDNNTMELRLLLLLAAVCGVALNSVHTMTTVDGGDGAGRQPLCTVA